MFGFKTKMIALFFFLSTFTISVESTFMYNIIKLNSCTSITNDKKERIAF